MMHQTDILLDWLLRYGTVLITLAIMFMFTGYFT